MLKALGNSRYMQYLSALTATLSLAASGTYGVWPSPSLPKLQGADSPLGHRITDGEGSWVVSVNVLAAIPASILAAWMIEKFGRRKTLLVSAVALFVPWLMIIFAKSLAVLIVARAIGGIGGGVVTAGCAIYAGEIAERDIRGRLGTSVVVLKLVGAFLVLVTGPYVSYVWLAIICASLPVIFLCSFYFMPETPYYLMKIGDKERAKRNLILLSSKSADDIFIEKQLIEIQSTIDSDMRNKTTLWEFLSKPVYRRSIFIMIGIKMLQQLCGLAAIDAYMQKIVEESESDISEETSSVIFGAVQVPSALIASVLVDKLGRKPLIIVSAVGCAVALIGEGIYFYILHVLQGDVSSINWLPTTAISVFFIMNPVGVSTLPYVLLGELFPTNIKGIAVSAFTMLGAILGFAVSKSFKPLSNMWGIHVMFWIFSVFCILGALFVLIFLPETKGKTFDDIQDILQNHRKNDTENAAQY